MKISSLHKFNAKLGIIAVRASHLFLRKCEITFINWDARVMTYFRSGCEIYGLIKHESGLL